MSLVVVTSLQKLPCAEGVDIVGHLLVGCHHIRWLNVLIQARIAVGKGAPHILATPALIARSGIGNGQSVLHEKQIDGVLRHIGSVSSNVFKIVVAIHQHVVHKRLVVNHTGLAFQILRRPQLTISRCGRMMGVLTLIERRISIHQFL